MKRIASICIALFAVSAIAEDVTSAFINCATTKADKQRLACYDKIRDDIVRANSPQKENERVSIALADLKPDLKTLRGKKVSVRASIQILGGTAMLKSDPMDMAPIFADIDALPRDDRKKLLNGCQMVMCSGTFYGTVKNLPLGTGLLLEKVTWN